MNLIVIIDLVFCATVIMALVLLALGWKRALYRDTKLILVAIFALLILHGSINILEWSNFQDSVDPLSDLVQSLQPLLWLFFLYAFLRETSERKLKRSEQRFRSLFEHSNDAIFIHDLQGVILDVNEKTQEMLGYSRDRILNSDLSQLNLESERNRLQKELERTGETGSSRFETKLRREDGKVIDVEVSSRIIDREGGVVQAIARDITERKRSEERKEFLDTLMRQDLSSKLHTLQGYLQLMEDEDLPEGVEKHLEKAIRADREANEILNLAWELRDIEQTDWFVKKDVVNALNHAVQEIPDLAKEQGVTIDRQFSEHLGSTMADYSLALLFSQLMKIRIQKSGCDRIEIDASAGEDDMVVTFEDNGSRLMEDIKKLFSGKAYTGETTGAGGVRYYMLRQIAEHNDLSIEVQDSELGGAAFRIQMKRV